MFEFKLPDLGEGIHEGELLEWHVKKGDHINEDEPLCDVETDKATVTIPSPCTGIIAQLNANPDDTVIVGSVLVVIDDSGVSETQVTEPEQSGRTKEDPVENTPSSPPRKKAIAAPATRRLAREMGIDINAVKGSGIGGKVLKEDLESFENLASEAEPHKDHEVPLSQEKFGPASKNGPPAANGIPFFERGSIPDFETQGPVKKAIVRSLRKKTAVKMTTSMIIAPHVAHMEECDVTDLEDLRKTFNEKQGDNKLTLMAFVIKAIASLLKDYPMFNASLDFEKMEIIYKEFYNIGFAADTPRGLMVPVIRDADRYPVSQIARKIRTLAQKGREGTITLPELSNGTFTVTNVGAIGGTGMIPIINYPESAILGLGRVDKKPVVKDDEIVIRNILPMTLSFDHRIADGVQAARLIKQLKQMLEDPVMFMTGI